MAATGAQMGLFTGRPPNDIGMPGGRLGRCKSTPNCVSSQADRATDPGHYVAPIRFQGTAEAA